LQPVAPAISNIRRVLDDPAGIAAASPVTATVGSANTGTAAVASLSAVSPSLNPNLTATITFHRRCGRLQLQPGRHDRRAADDLGHRSWTAGQPVKLNGWSLELNGVPRSGDVIGVQKTAYPAGNNGNANALLGLRDVPFVGQQTLGRRRRPARRHRHRRLCGRAREGRCAGPEREGFRPDQSASIAADAKTAQASMTGVNLDEEAARLIQFQQSYQGRRQDAAGRAVAVRHAAADQRLIDRYNLGTSSPCASRPPTPSTSASTP
jgi:flagellar hook-associated protein 1 FlgK